MQKPKINIDSKVNDEYKKKSAIPLLAISPIKKHK